MFLKSTISILRKIALLSIIGAVLSIPSRAEDTSTPTVIHPTVGLPHFLSEGYKITFVDHRLSRDSLDVLFTIVVKDNQTVSCYTTTSVSQGAHSDAVSVCYSLNEPLPK